MSYPTVTKVLLPKYTAETPVCFVRHLISLFESGQCGYEAAVLWRENAFKQGLILCRKHILIAQGQGLVIHTTWRDVGAYQQYRKENNWALSCAKKIVEEQGGSLVDCGGLEVLNNVDTISIHVFDKYKRNISG